MARVPERENREWQGQYENRDRQGQYRSGGWFDFEAAERSYASSPYRRINRPFGLW
jgi:hypothetical protein